jgi:hypothetical protein
MVNKEFEEEIGVMLRIRQILGRYLLEKEYNCFGG